MPFTVCLFVPPLLHWHILCRCDCDDTAQGSQGLRFVPQHSVASDNISYLHSSCLCMSQPMTQPVAGPKRPVNGTHSGLPHSIFAAAHKLLLPVPLACQLIGLAYEISPTPPSQHPSSLIHPNPSQRHMLCEFATAATLLLSCAGDSMYEDHTAIMELDKVDDFDWFLPDMTAPSSPAQS